jgi:hypothetical protein
MPDESIGVPSSSVRHIPTASKFLERQPDRLEDLVAARTDGVGVVRLHLLARRRHLLVPAASSGRGLTGGTFGGDRAD